MLKIAKLEMRLKKGSKKVSSIAIASLILTLMLMYQIASSGVRLDEGIYSSNLEIGHRSFTVSENPDILIEHGKVYLRGDLKSLSAFDEFRKYLREEYNKWIYEKYGEKAFPVLVNLHEIPTEVKIAIKSIERPEKVVTPKEKEVGTPKPVTTVEERTTVGESETQEVVPTFKEFKTEVRYTIPENLQPPILLEKFVYAFLLVMPFYFVAQIFSSSFMEDKVKRRFDVILTVVSAREFLLGKMIPYVTLGSAISIAIAIIFGKALIMVLLISILILMLSIDSFLVFLSRSYKEMSFISVVVTLVVTAYLFIPAVFSFIPMSKLSPVTLLVESIEGGETDLRYVLLSVSHLALMSFILINLTSNSFEFMYTRGLIEKVVELTAKLTDRYYKVFTFVLVSIPFVLLTELFTIAITFPLRDYIFPVLIVLALVEEFFKGLFIYSASMNKLNPYVSAILSASGFFVGEKLILIPLIPANVLSLLLLPLLAHIVSSLIFVITMKWGFRVGLAVSSILHSTYNGLMVWMLLI
ncbi:ABC transporter permease family protein [Archaeoglobus profundus]|uniref:Uncharacterized protein n=1 Tax=Archaeoglobus profundus (strain DSM 5631 / JCM 9629 / NBRC 100127 / Av18) TaxID=572546 RepID=D2RIA1_ARCPA|nr:hypothetical protein [Archaeoglobus profundus]ADB58026.1 hypothetical protein Arcpr_0965 [Archaeoglobus profundus DSM 5631]